MNSSHRFAALAALEAWHDAGLARPERDDDASTGTPAPCSAPASAAWTRSRERVVPLTDAGKVRRLGSTAVEQVMASGISARVSGLLALGNQVTTNSSACSTGTEAIVDGVPAHPQRPRRAHAVRRRRRREPLHLGRLRRHARAVRAASTTTPERASRPMSASAGGFVPGAGAGVLLLESLDSARARGARIYAELLGGAVNCGGHRGGGSMTAPNPEGVRRCIRAALARRRRRARRRSTPSTAISPRPAPIRSRSGRGRRRSSARRRASRRSPRPSR